MNREVRKIGSRGVYNGQLAKITCGQCGRPNSVVLQDFTLLGHGPATGCRGPREGVFEDLLPAEERSR